MPHFKLTRLIGSLITAYKHTQHFIGPFISGGGVIPPIIQNLPRWFRDLGPEPTYLVDEGGATAPTDVLNQPGVAARWDGVNDFLSIRLNAAVTFPFTMCCWFNIENYAADCPLMSIIGDDFATEYFYFKVKTTGAVEVTRANGATQDTTVAAASSVSTGYWRHLTVCFVDATSVTAYLDGYQVYSNTGLTSISLGAQFDRIVLGADEAFASYFLYGRLYDCRLYDREITIDEACEIYNSTKRPEGSPQDFLYPANLIGHWRLDEGDVSDLLLICLDSSGNDQKPEDFSGTIQYLTDTTLPFRWFNEVGGVDLEQYPFPSFDGLTHTETTMAAYAADWTASGANATATVLTNKLGHATVLKAAFTSGATVGQQCYCPNIDHVLPGSPNTMFGLVRIRLSRALTGTEKIDIGLSESGFNTVVKSLGAGYLDGSSTPYVNTWANGTCLCAVDTSTAQLSVYVVGALTADLVVYVSDVTFVYNAGTDVSSLYYGVPFNRFFPTLSSDETQDLWGNTVEITGPLAKRVKLKQSPCLTLDGVNDYGSASDFLSGGAAMSACCWMKCSSAGGTDYDTMISHYDAASNLRSFNLYTVGGKLRIYITQNGTAGANEKVYDNSRTINDGTWHHAGFTFAANDLRLFIDGIEVEVTKTIDSSVTALFNSTVAVQIGRALNGGVTLTGSDFTGQLADVRIYEATLSAADMLAIYNGESIATAPKAHYPLTENEGLVAYDVSGNGYHMTLSGMTSAQAWANRQDVYHGALTTGFRCLKRRRKFNGTNQYLSLASGSETAFRSGTVSTANHVDMWWAAWVVPSAASSGRSIIGKGLDTATNREFTLYQFGSNYYIFATSDGTTNSSAMATTPAQIGVPAFLFAYHDPVTNVIAISVNDSAFVTTSFSGGIWSTNNTLSIGTRQSAVVGVFYEYFSGNIRMAAVGKPPSNPADWTVLRDLIYNNGAVATYDDISDANHTTWGTVDWFDMDGAGNTEIGRHAGTTLTGTNMTVDRTPQVLALDTAPTKHYQVFDGSSHYYQKDSNSSLQAGDIDFWVACYFYLHGNVAVNVFAAKHRAATAFREWYLATTTATNLAMTMASSIPTYGVANQTISQNQWVFAVGYFNATANVVGLSVNGSAFATTAFTDVPVTNTSEFRIGAFGTSTGAATSFTSSAIKLTSFGKPPSNPADWTVLRDLLYNGGSPLSYADLTAQQKTDWGLVSWWDMDDAGTGYLLDSHGTNHMMGSSIPSNTTHPTGVLHNEANTKLDFTGGVSAPWVGKWNYPGYFQCVGSANGLSVINSISGISTTISILFRIRNISLADNRTVFGGDDGALGNMLQVGIRTDSDIFIYTDKFYEMGGDGAWAAYADGSFHDVLLTIAGTAAKLYVDDVLVDSQTLDQGIDWSSSFTRAKILSHPNGTSNKFYGDIHRIAIWSTAVTSGNTTGDVLDIKFQYNRIEDMSCQMPSTLQYSGVGSFSDSILTSYTYGDTLSSTMSKTYTDTSIFETEYDVDDPDPNSTQGVVTPPTPPPATTSLAAWSDGNNMVWSDGNNWKWSDQ